MTIRCVLLDRHVLFQVQGMPLSDNTEVAVSKQCLDANFRPHILQDTNLEIRAASC